MMELFGSALIPDFQREYGIDLMAEYRKMDELRLYYLITGLSGNSLYRGRLLGEETSRGFSETDDLLLNIRNELEQLKLVTLRANGAKKSSINFEGYKQIPGRKIIKHRQMQRKTHQLLDYLQRTGKTEFT